MDKKAARYDHSKSFETGNKFRDGIFAFFPFFYFQPPQKGRKKGKKMAKKRQKKGRKKARKGKNYVDNVEKMPRICS